ncbi:COX15/CtaA family protein [Rhodovibrionaceae bacterium A322]
MTVSASPQSPKRDRALNALTPGQAGDGAYPAKALAGWLLGVCGLIFAMAVIGAITRLTESGLSIMEWAPIKGALPPLSQAEWERVFALYKTIPQYKELNAGMSLAEFKEIFWWEWIHRLWGRMIGLAYALPFFWFLWRHSLPGPLKTKLWIALVLGGLQGFMGWYMVASGFADRTEVSQYRLVAHLGLALLIYGYLFWIALSLLLPDSARDDGPAAQKLRPWLLGLLALVILTIAWGGFVAGLNAGLVYNSFPLMDGDLIPADYSLLDSWWRNHFETHGTVQFNHRALAIATLVLSVLLFVWSRRMPLNAGVKQALALVKGWVLVQVALGIATLLLVVPVWLGALHQAGAIVLLTLVLNALYRVKRV